MSANLLDGIKPTITQYGSMADGVLTSTASKDAWQDVARWPIAADTLAENQAFHIGLSAKWHGTAATTGTAWASVEYADASGYTNAVDVKIDGITTEWKRLSLSAVVPSGMRVVDFRISADHLDAAFDATSLVLSYGSPVTLATAAHTPYATQDHVAAEYATKASLKVTSDAVTAEVTERGRLAGRVGTLESTSGTHTSKLSQLAASITSLVKGESTYTDPDGKSATSGIYSLVTQTRDSVTALFGDYTKTSDLASTQAVKDAKKAGTDAQAAASAAQSTADAAKATADGLSTMIRQDADGITVGKSADGKTWSTTRTRMGASAFEVLTKAGEVASSFGEKIIELGKNSADAVIRMCGGNGMIGFNTVSEQLHLSGTKGAYLARRADIDNGRDYGVGLVDDNGSSVALLQAQKYLVAGTTLTAAQMATAIQQVNAPCVVTRQVTATKDNGSSLAATVTAPTVDGYAFVAWVGVATDGDVGTPYIEKATSTTTPVWDQARKGSYIVATALYQRS